MASAFEEEVLPTEQEIAFYREHGWLLTRLSVTDACLRACGAAVEEVYSGRYDSVHPWSADKGSAGFGQRYLDRTRPRLDAYVSHHKRAVAEVAWSRHLGAYAAALMDAREVRLFRDVLLTMPARLGYGTGWHVDKNYWPTCSSDLLTTAWFSLSDCDVTDGCLSVVSGSHRWRSAPFVRKIPYDDGEALRRLRGAEGAPRGARPGAPDVGPVRVTPIPHRRGQISFHSCLLVHGTRPNAGPVTRQSFAVVLQDGENRYVAPGDQASARLASFNTNDRVGPRSRDGLPDYADPDFYPVLYDEGAPGAAAPDRSPG